MLDALKAAGVGRVTQTPVDSVPWNEKPVRLPTEQEMRQFGLPTSPAKR